MINDEGYLYWYREKFEELLVVIILWIFGFDEDNYDGERICNEFNIGVIMVLNLKIDDYKKLVCFYFVKFYKLIIFWDI